MLEGVLAVMVMSFPEPFELLAAIFRLDISFPDENEEEVRSHYVLAKPQSGVATDFETVVIDEQIHLVDQVPHTPSP